MGKFASTIQSLQAQDAQQASLAVEQGPDEMGRALAIARERGAPPLAVAANLPDFEAEQRREELAAAAREHPTLGSWLGTPEHAALARDDVPALSKLSASMRPVSVNTDRTWGEVFADLGLAARTMGRSGLADLAEAPVSLVNWLNQALNNDAARLAGLFGQTPSSMIPMRQELFGFEQEFRAITEEVNAADVAQNQSFRQSALESNRPNTFTGQLGFYADHPALIGTDLAGAGGYMAAGGIIPGRTQATLVTQAVSQASGAVAETKRRLLEQGLDEDAATARASEVFGAALAIGIVAPKIVPGGQSFERLIGGEVADNAASRLGRAAIPLVGEPLSEGLEEGAIALTQNLGAGDPAFKGVGGATAAGMVAGLGMAAPSSVAGFMADTREANAAKTREQLSILGRIAGSMGSASRLEAITLAASEAKTGKRAPETLEGLAPDETVFIPAEAVRTLYQSDDVLGFVERLTGDANALEVAGEHGDLAVPMAKWVSVVSQLPNAAEWARHARSDLDGHSRADLDGMDLEAELARFDTSEAAERATPEQQEASDRIEQDVMGMLVSADRYRPADAELQAKFMARVFRVMGQRADMDPWELYSRYKLRINGRPEKPSLLNRAVDGVRSLFQRSRTPDSRPALGDGKVSVTNGEITVTSTGWRSGFGPGKPLENIFEARIGGSRVGRVQLDLDDGVMRVGGLSVDAGARRLGVASTMIDAAFTAVPGVDNLGFLGTTGDGGEFVASYGEQVVDGRRTIRRPDRLRPAAPTQGQSGVESAHAQQDLESRIAQWAASLHLGGSGPRAVAASPESVGPVARNATGAAEQGEESREALREQSERLIARAKAEGFYWETGGPIFAEIGKLPTLGGAEHQVFVVGEGANRLVIRATDNGYFGPRADISPAQYLARLDDFSNTFPGLQTRVIGVSESPDVEGHAVIWTAQPFVYGKKFMHQSRLAEAMAAHGWKEDGTFRFVHEATGAVIEDAHTDNVFEGENGDLYPFDVVVESLPARTLEQPADGGAGPRGSLDIGADRSMAINLFAGANLSTFLHESGHFFLEVMRDVAADPNAPQAVKDDWQAILAYLGNDGGEITTEQHEVWARSFEAYLMEGQAPAPELVGAFARFRAWLVSIYRALSALNVNLTPEVRSVMDRMIATDEEIEAAQVKQGMTPLELPPESRALVSDAQWAQYVAALQAGTEEARQEVFAKLVAAHKRAAERWYKEEAARTREEVEAELDALPIMRAWRILRGSRDESIPENLRGLKLDRDAIAAMFDPDTGKRMLERLRAMYRKEGGVSPDTAAALLGFTSGDELVRKLAGVPDLLAQVEQEVQARMQEKHPDPLLDGNVPDMAMAAVHNNKRLQAMDAELGLLATLANQPRPNRRALKAIAERVIAGKTIRSLRPNQHLVAERKAAREATKAAAQGNYAEALAAKREQALQAALYAEALRVQERAERQIEALRKAGTDKTRERVGKAGKSYVEALDDLLEGHELKPVSAREVARRASLRAWIAQQQEADNHTAVSEELLARVERENVINVRDLTAAQLADLHEAVTNLLHLASVKNRLQTRRGKIDWEEAKALLRDRLAEQDGRGGGISASDRALLEGVQDLGSAVGNWVLQPETVVEWLDGGVDGPWHDLLWEPSEEAEHAREALQREVGAKLEAAFNALPKDERAALDRRHYVASLGQSVSGHTILSALLNMGTASNRDKLLRGGRVDGDTTTPFTPEQLAEMFSKLSGSQAQLVQGIWDAVHTLWPHVVALEEELNGIAPEKVEAEPVTIVTRDGPVTLRGGYFPAAYDPRGAKVGRMAEDEQAKRVLSGGLPIKASTSKGHTEKRTDYVAPLLLDYHAVLTRHLDGVMSDLAYRKFLKQAYKILDDAELARMVDNRIGPNGTKVLKSGMERGAVGSFSLAGPLFGPFQKIADGTMTNVSAAALGLRVPLALANIITAPILASARVNPRFVAEGFATYYRNPKAGARLVHALSPMMLRRAEARTVEWRSMLDNLRGKRGLRRQMIEFTMSVHQWIVPLAENAIWIGAYRQALSAGQEASEAVRLADKAIRQTQTKHTAKDLSLAEGSPYLRWAMMFAGPLAVINNRLQESGLRGLRGAVNSPMQALATWAAMAAGGVWVFELLMGRGPDDEDEDGDTDIGDWTRWCAIKLGLMPFAAFPILRDIGSAIDQGFARSNPLVDAGMSLWKFGQTAWESGEALFDGDDVDEEKLAKDTTRAIGTVTGLPSGQAVRSGTYFMEVATGQHTPDNPAAEAVYLLQGPPKE